MGIQKEQKSTFLTAFEHREKRLAACLLHNNLSQLSLNVFVMRAQHSVQLPDICIV